MHYIRFLKLPALTAPVRGQQGPGEVSVKITITNDLGEQFLNAAIALLFTLRIHTSTGKVVEKVWREKWMGDGQRQLHTKSPLDGTCLRALDRGRCELIVSREGVKDKSVGLGRIIPVHSEFFGADRLGGDVTTAKRVFVQEMAGQKRTMTVREEKGESIARHVWDAGLILSELMYSLFCEEGHVVSKQLPKVCGALRRKGRKVIELGTGVGLVGLRLNEVLAACKIEGQVLLTDLEDAREIAEMNIEASQSKESPSVQFQDLDWTEPVPANVQKEAWDLVLIADCTYNPDYAQDLVNTIKSLVVGSRDGPEDSEGKETIVLLAMKPRHDAENVFFDYMAEAGMQVLEEARVDIPVLGGEPQLIRILGFGLAGEGSSGPAPEEQTREPAATKRRVD
jgi:hypothetical protein